MRDLKAHPSRTDTANVTPSHACKVHYTIKNNLSTYLPSCSARAFLSEPILSLGSKTLCTAKKTAPSNHHLHSTRSSHSAPSPSSTLSSLWPATYITHCSEKLIPSYLSFSFFSLSPSLIFKVLNNLNIFFSFSIFCFSHYNSFSIFCRSFNFFFKNIISVHFLQHNII